jgi:hypothetical protein
MKKKMYGANSSARVVPRNARKSRKLREAMEMGRGYAIGMALISFALPVACRAGPRYEAGGPAVERVKQALGMPHDSEAALSTGLSIYLLRPGALPDERARLIARLRGSTATEPATAGEGLMAACFTRPQVFESRCEAGVIHVERVTDDNGVALLYRIWLLENARESAVDTRPTPQIEGAWRALFDKARRAAQSDPLIDMLPTRADRPLDEMRELGIDPE